MNLHPSSSVLLVALIGAVSACALSHRGGDGGADANDLTTDGVGQDGRDTPDSPVCPLVDFVAPAQNAILGPSMDADLDCSNGFQYDVQLTTSAVNGTQLALWVNGVQRAVASVSGPVVTFSRVEFDAHGMQTLQIRLPGSSLDCVAPRVFRTACATPGCSITEPVQTTLNASNNESSDPLHFATHITVSTDIEDGRTVELVLSPGLPQTATATGGVARFNSVAMSPDGRFQVRAMCTNAAGTVGPSAPTTFTVDTTPPTLSVVSPAAGATIPFSAADVDTTAPGKQFRVCARSDAAGQTLTAAIHGTVPDALGTGTVPSSVATDACVEITCPSGGAAFDVDFAVSDAAGNRSTATLVGVSCASTLPSVRIVDPISSVMTDTTTFLNAARDGNVGAAGLQYGVVACSDRDTGMATLSINGAVIGSPVALVVADTRCAGAGFRSTAQFAGATLPQSMPAMNSPTGSFPTNPTITVSVTDGVGDIGTSPIVTVFVDSIAPAIATAAPACGSLVVPDATGGATVDLAIATTDVPLTVNLQPGTGTPRTLTASAFSSTGQVNINGVAFTAGPWTITGSATDFAGNAATAAACTIFVGNPPALEFTTPLSGARYSAAGDGNASSLGYQGATVSLLTDVTDGTTVTLTVAAGTPITAVASGGHVNFANVALPEGDAIALTASVTDGPRGTRSVTVTVLVDTQVPAVPTGILGIVTARRAGTVRVTWTSAGDPGPSGPPSSRAAASYDLRWSRSPISTSAQFAAATPVAFAGTPQLPGATESTDVVHLELGVGGSHSYYFAVRSSDAAGNLSTTLATSAPIALDVLLSRVQEATGSGFGQDLSGGFDLNGDGIHDLVVGSRSGQVRIYFGQSGAGVTAPNSTTILGAAGTFFGFRVLSTGDVNGDGLGDVAIGDFQSNRVLLYLGRLSSGPGRFPIGGTLGIGNADVTIQASGADFTSSGFGRALTRADFNGDGLSDIVIGAPWTRSNTGSVVVIPGRPALASTIMVPTDAAILAFGAASGDYFGSYVGFAGPVAGGDSRDEILVTSYGSTSSGVAYLFNGRDFGGSQIALTPSNASWTAVTGDPGATAVLPAMLGDINGDGLADLGFGAISGAGAAHLFFGNGSSGFDLGPTIPGPDLFGASLSRVTRRTGLHSSLLRPNSPEADVCLGNSPAAPTDPRLSIFRGRASWAGLSSTSADEVVTFTRSSRTSGMSASSTSPTAWVGDVDGDGNEDFAVGQFTEDLYVVVH